MSEDTENVVDEPVVEVIQRPERGDSMEIVRAPSGKFLKAPKKSFRDNDNPLSGYQRTERGRNYMAELNPATGITREMESRDNLHRIATSEDPKQSMAAVKAYSVEREDNFGRPSDADEKQESHSNPIVAVHIEIQCSDGGAYEDRKLRPSQPVWADGAAPDFVDAEIVSTNGAPNTPASPKGKLRSDGEQMVSTRPDGTTTDTPPLFVDRSGQ